MAETVISSNKPTENADYKRTDINLSDSFKCCVDDLFQCFINPGMFFSSFMSSRIFAAKVFNLESRVSLIRSVIKRVSDKMKAYFNGAAEVDPRESGKFSKLGGMITGTYLEIQPNESVSFSKFYWRPE